MIGSKHRSARVEFCLFGWSRLSKLTDAASGSPNADAPGVVDLESAVHVSSVSDEDPASVKNDDLLWSGDAGALGLLIGPK